MLSVVVSGRAPASRTRERIVARADRILSARTTGSCDAVHAIRWSVRRRRSRRSR
jgi:hypothetical protein